MLKNIEKIQSVITSMKCRHFDGDEVLIDMINEFIVDNTPLKDAKKDLFQIAAHDKLRPVMCGVYHDADKQMAVASDSHVLIAAKEGYNAEYANTTRDKYGKRIEGNYPKWQCVVPSYENKSRTFDIDVEYMKHCIAKYDAVCKSNAFKSKDKEYIMTAVKVCDGVWIRPHHAVAVSPWATSFVCHPTENNRACVHKSNDTIAIIMPLCVDENKYEGLKFVAVDVRTDEMLIKE